jgi:PleD family two-component response regulator
VTELEVFRSSDRLKVLVVDSARLYEHVCDIRQSIEETVSVFGRDAALARLEEGPFDIVLLTVWSAFDTLSTAAAVRGIERQQRLPHRAAIIACTSNASDYEDCATQATLCLAP